MQKSEPCPRFPQKDFVSFFMGKNVRKKSSKFFRWPEMLLTKSWPKNFQMTAVTKILGRRDNSIAPLLSTENRKTFQTKTLTACTAVTAMQR